MASRGSSAGPWWCSGVGAVSRVAGARAGSSLHGSTVLSYSERVRNRTVMLDPAEVAAVIAAVARYRDALARTESEGNAGLAALLARRANARRANARRGR